MSQKYIEGSSYNKAIEIFNGTGLEIDLAGYTIELYFSGGTTVNYTLDLSGKLADGEVYVITNSSAGAEVDAQSDITSNVSNFNGDDVLVLKHNGTIIDVIGISGDVDFGKDITLVRNSDIKSGNPAYDVNEWTSYGQDQLFRFSHNGLNNKNVRKPHN